MCSWNELGGSALKHFYIRILHFGRDRENSIGFMRQDPDDVFYHKEDYINLKVKRRLL